MFTSGGALYAALTLVRYPCAYDTYVETARFDAMPSKGDTETSWDVATDLIAHSTECVGMPLNALGWQRRALAKRLHYICLNAACMFWKRTRSCGTTNCCFWSILVTFGGRSSNFWSILHLLDSNLWPNILLSQLSTLGEGLNTWTATSDRGSEYDQLVCLRNVWYHIILPYPRAPLFVTVPSRCWQYDTSKLL